MYLELHMLQIYPVIDVILNGLALILVGGCGLYAVVAHRREKLTARNWALLGILGVVVFRLYLGTFIPTEQPAENYVFGG